MAGAAAAARSPDYELPATPDGVKMREFLAICASGQLELYYENGLPVPRSLFHSRCAVLLLSAKPGTRRLVRTPYGFGSGMEIFVSEQAAKRLETGAALP